MSHFCRMFRVGIKFITNKEYLAKWYQFKSIIHRNHAIDIDTFTESTVWLDHLRAPGYSLVHLLKALHLASVGCVIPGGPIQVFYCTI